MTVKPKVIETKIYRTHSNDAKLSNREHVARQSYRCVRCNDIITKGTRYSLTVEIDDGYFMSNRWHTECHQSYSQTRQ